MNHGTALWTLAFALLIAMPGRTLLHGLPTPQPSTSFPSDGMCEPAHSGADPDRTFATLMIPHHQKALEMAQEQLLHGKNPVLRRLAEEIIVTQSQEIAVLQGQLNTDSSACYAPLPSYQ